jgi:transcriptional regulator with XRE-family HTH domain
MEKVRLDSIGANIRKCRLSKKLRQEDLAEKANLSVTYIGMIERGEKTPSVETLVTILNAMGVSADVVLCDVLDAGYEIKHSMLDEKLSKLSLSDRNKIYDVIDTMIAHSSKNQK